MDLQTDGRELQGGAAVRRVEALVASAFSVPPEAIRAPGRGVARTAFARQVAIYLNHTRLGLNYAEAASPFGRDRTTAAHACRRVEDRREDPRIDAIVDVLERAVSAWTGAVAQ
jgi:chromosomal replication initiation ATPase DnaA